MNMSQNYNLIAIYGSSWLIDSIYLFIISPLGFFGFIFNALSLFVFLKVKINKKLTVLFTYFKIYCINSAIICLLVSTSLYAYSPRYVGVHYDLLARIGKCLFANYIATSLYYFGNILDIILSVHRLCLFKTKPNLIKKWNPFFLSLIMLTLCFIVNVPTALRLDIKSDEQIHHDLNFGIYNSTIFSICSDGLLAEDYVLIGLNILFRDFITLFLEIVTICLIIYRFGKYKMRKNALKIKVNMRSRHLENRLTVMTLYLSLISIFTHVTMLFTFIIFLLPFDDKTVGLLVMICILSITFKHSVNVLVFYKFNSHFKSIFLQIFDVKLVKVNETTKAINQKSIFKISYSTDNNIRK